MENNNNSSLLNESHNTGPSSENHNQEEEHTPQLFSNEIQTDEDLDQATDDYNEKLFDQDSNEEEDFEIPAFLRKQKF